MARYSLFVLKVLLNTSQLTNHAPLSAAVLSYPSVTSAALSANMLYTYGQLLLARVTPCSHLQTLVGDICSRRFYGVGDKSRQV